MKYLLLLLACIVIVSCQKPRAYVVADITTGLVVNMPLDGNAYDSVSKTTGAINTHGGFYVIADNRHGVGSTAISFFSSDSN